MKRLKKILRYGLISLGVFSVLVYGYIVYPVWGIPFNSQRHGLPPLTPAWALECWLWEDDVNTAEYPVYIKTGAIIPLHIQRSYTGIGDFSSAAYITWMVYPGQSNAFTIYSTDQQEATRLQLTEENDKLHLDFSGKKLPHILRVHLDHPPKGVQQDGKKLTDYFYDALSHKLVINMESYQNGSYLIDQGQ